MSVSVTITGTGNKDYCSVTIAGTRYTTATTGLEVQTGDSIRFDIRGSNSGGTGTITIDGEVVTSSSNLTARSYTWTVPAGISAITIALSSSPHGVITVTTGEPEPPEPAKTHRTLIEGVGFSVSAGRCLVDGVGYSIQKGRTLIDGAGYDVAFGPSGPVAGDVTVGSSVWANVNGVRTEFLVVHQGNPDTALYDTSCDGTWLLAKDIYEKRALHSSAANDYENSAVHSYLNSTFIGLLDENVQSVIKQVKLPYRKGSGSGTGVTSGASGLVAKTFLLSGVEVNWSSSTFSYFPNDGACLSYFFGCATTDPKRIAYLNGSATIWWLRSPCCSSTYGATRMLAVASSGSYTNIGCTGSYGVRPAFILDSSATIDPNTFDILG